MSRLNWQIKKLPDVVFFQEGPGVRNSQYTDDGVKLLNVGNLQNGQVVLDNTDRYISEEEAYGKYSHFLVDEGDLIIGSSGIKVEYFEKKMGFVKKEHLPLCMNTSTIRFKSLEPNNLNIRFFMYFLKSNGFKGQITKLITGSAQLNFGPSHLKQIRVGIPCIQRQNKIVQALDTAQSLIDKRKEQIEACDELIKSLFYEMFGDPGCNPIGWDVGTIRDLVSEVKYGTSKKADENTGLYPILRMNNLTYRGSIDISDLKYVDLDDKEKDKYLVRKGQILFNRTNSKELVGKTGVFKLDTPMAYAGYLIRVTANEYNNPEFISAYLNSKYCKTMLRETCKSIVGMANINAQELQDIMVPIVPLELQNQFASKVQQIEHQMSLFQQSLTEMENNFNSLMQRAFKGELFPEE